jgi:hypothetical protein
MAEAMDERLRSLGLGKIVENAKPRWSSLGWRYFKLRRRLVRAVYSRLYRDNHRDTRNCMLVAGMGRSGTTWLAEIVASQVPCRIMFEPFNPTTIRAFRRFHYFHYMRPSEEDNQLQSYCQTIFTGAIRHPWIDSEVAQLRPNCRLVKEVRANLFLKWIRDRFPEIPLVFVLRHPCAVAVSRMQLGWTPDPDLEPFLSQPNLVSDFLAEKLDIICRATTDEEKHAIVWCISNLVPLRQFTGGALDVIFYERMCLEPEVQLPRLFRIVGQTYRESAFVKAGEPSRTVTRSSAVLTGKDRVAQWKNLLSHAQIRNILRVVESFGLDYLYGDSPEPLVAECDAAGAR